MSEENNLENIEEETENAKQIETPEPASTTNSSESESDAIDLAPYIYPLASFLIPLLVYWRTLCKALYIGDGGDFITASHTLGLPHPPGYPLYTLLGKLFLLLPIPGGLSWAAWRMNFMSAFFGALTTLLVFFLIKKLTKYDWLAFFAAIAVGFARTFWSQAVITEVYTLNTFFILLQLYLLHVRTEKYSSNTLIWLGLVLGLSLTHHPSIAIFFPAYIYYSVVHRDTNLTRLLIVALAFGLAIIKPPALALIFLLIPHEIIIQYVKPKEPVNRQGFAVMTGLVLFFLSLCLYAYLPIVQYKNPVTGPMQFESIQDNIKYFKETVTRQIYNYKAMSPGEKLTTTPMVIRQYFIILINDYNVLALIFLLGFMALLRRIRMAWVVLICYMIFMAVILFYPSGDILRAQLKNLEVVMPPLMIPAQLMFILFGFMGIGCLLDWIPKYVDSMKEVDPMPVETKTRFLSGVLIGSLFLLVLILIPFNNWQYCDKSNSLIAYNYARNVIRSAPDDSFVLNTGDETFLFWYLTEVENYMPEKKIDLQNWIHNIRDFDVLVNEDQAIRDVLLWVLKNREWSVTDPEFKIPDHMIPTYKHYCATFLTDKVQKDTAFASQDVKMHGLVYEFLFKQAEYYEKYNYDIHPELGIVQTIEPSENEYEETEYISLEERRFNQSYFDDDYPGVRLLINEEKPYDHLHWEGLFVPKYDATKKVIELTRDESYKDPQEQEIIGRYQEMFHNIGAWSMHQAQLTEDEDKKIELLRSATASFQDEIKLAPLDPPGWLSLGNAYLQMRIFKEAVEALNQHKIAVYASNSSTVLQKASAHYYLAYALFVKGNLNHALQEIDTSLLLDPDNENAVSLRETILEQTEIARKKIDRMREELEKEEQTTDEFELKLDESKPVQEKDTQDNTVDEEQ